MTARDEQEYAVLQVNNLGRPIPTDQLRHIFEPFRRGDAPKSAGLGLGLYIVERIVHAHGGTIAVQSTEPEGTTFFVRILAAGRPTSARPLLLFEELQSHEAVRRRAAGSQRRREQ